VIWLDLAIVGFAFLMAIWGYSRGLLAGGLWVVGFVAGGFVGARVGGFMLEEGPRSPAITGFALVGAILVAAALGSGSTWLRTRRVERGAERLHVADRLGGALVLACLGLAVVWLIAAVTQAQRTDLRVSRSSRILGALDAALPPSRPILNALAIRPVTRPVDPVPKIAVEGGPRTRGPQLVERTPKLGQPDPRIARNHEVERAGRSVVRVMGTACARRVQGSGWVAEEGVVVTNAHIVAGQEDTRVELRDGSRHDADAVWYEPKNDLAVLRSSGLTSAGVRPLKLRLGAPAGTSTAILGYPVGGPYRALPGRLGPTQTVVAQDSYGRGPIDRRVTALRGRVRPGNSGGPVVDGAGRVAATVMLGDLSKRRRQRTALGVVDGFGIPAPLMRRALARADKRVGTGPCSR
jgi:S1-C subfamily serine protease